MDSNKDTECLSDVRDTPLASTSKRIRLDEPVYIVSSDDSRSSTPDSIFNRDFQNPYLTDRRMVGINAYDDPTENNIMHWQMNQITRSIADNTVNRVVDSYINQINDGIEQSTMQMAIRMAIHEHGLGLQETVPDAIRRAISPARTDFFDILFDDDDSLHAPPQDATPAPRATRSIASLLRYDDLDIVEDFANDHFSDTESESVSDSTDQIQFLATAVDAAIENRGLELSNNPVE